MLSQCSHVFVLQQVAPNVNDQASKFCKCIKPYLHSRNWFLFTLTNNALSRGDDICSSEVGWAHLFILPFPAIVGPDSGYIFYILKDCSKANKDGNTQFAGFIPRMNPLFCGVNACAEYLFLS